MITLIKKLLKSIHHSIPLRARRVYMPVLSRWLYFFQNNLNAFFPMVSLYDGLELKSQTPLSFLYAGDIHQMHNYWDHFILSDGFRKRLLGRRFFWKIIPEIKKNFPDCGFLIMEQSSLTIPYFDKKSGFPIPFWVRMEIDIEPPLNKLFAQQRLDIERRIRKNKLSFEMTKDPQHFDDFYHTMYVPYIKERYTDTAGINSYESFLKTIPLSEMLLIKKDGKVIAGASIEFKDGKPMLRRLGIVDSNQEYMRLGAIGAIYYFLVQELKKRGYTLMDIGGTRPLLNDGLTRYKLSLKARLSKDNNQRSCVRFAVLQDTQGARSFLIHNPFLFKNKEKKLCRALFVENNGELSPAALNAAFASSYCEGIGETRIYVFGDKNLPEDLRVTNHQPVSVQSSEALIKGVVQDE